MSELFLYNDHHAKDNGNCAKKWFEFDLTYNIMRIMNAVGIIKLKPSAIMAQKRIERNKFVTSKVA